MHEARAAGLRLALERGVQRRAVEPALATHAMCAERQAVGGQPGPACLQRGGAQQFDLGALRALQRVVGAQLRRAGMLAK